MTARKTWRKFLVTVATLTLAFTTHAKQQDTEPPMSLEELFIKAVMVEDTAVKLLRKKQPTEEWSTEELKDYLDQLDELEKQLNEISVDFNVFSGGNAPPEIQQSLEDQKEECEMARQHASQLLKNRKQK